jgi:ATP-dependent exoDNAse (exonuclease V) beta subunit
MAREVAVTAEVGGALVDGRVDLLFEEDGELVAVELKTDDDATEGPEQVALYREALGRALGRPVKEALVVRVG